ncbi:winged helix-turn-helix domain-containing protein [Halococcus sp. AFM35]|uniref:winged helix-turn-helix domain-containing protein n=1 Tax=Halococcus sp. AFM35 TaxID=3421653 RepID=UPI003EB7562E
MRGCRARQPPSCRHHFRLTDDQWDELTATRGRLPSEAGIDASAWRLPLVRDYIVEIFDVEYSSAHMYRVMKKTGLSV